MVNSHIQMDKKRLNCDATSEMSFRNELELTNAVRAGNNSLVRQILVENRFNPKIENQTKLSALTEAAREGHDSIVNYSGATSNPPYRIFALRSTLQFHFQHISSDPDFLNHA